METTVILADQLTATEIKKWALEQRWLFLGVLDNSLRFLLPNGSVCLIFTTREK